MLAQNSEHDSACGALSGDVQKPLTFLNEVIDFIAAELPRWRDRPERPAETAEPQLTSRLCTHLNSTTRHSKGFDILQFRTEVPDEQNVGRKIDLAPAPCGVTIIVEGRRYLDFDILMPIECKRLPTPIAADRDEREYVFHQHKTTGGIQRFKAGHHGGSHSLGAMIGFVQAETSTIWLERTAVWIRGLVALGIPGWTEGDVPQMEKDDRQLRMAFLKSSHERGNGRSKIELRHLWVEMN